MATPSIQTLITQAQQVLNLKSSNEIRATLAAVLANANVGTPLNPNLTTQQLWDEFYEIVRQPTDDIMSIITDQMMRLVFTPPAPGGAGANTQVIFNDAGALAGDAGLVYNKTTDKLTVSGTVEIWDGPGSGADNIGIGRSTLGALTSGANNVSIGQTSLNALTSGGNNIAVGQSALALITSASDSIAIGRSALAACVVSDQVAIGTQALLALTSGANNTAVGRDSLRGLISSSNCTALGYQAARVTTAADVTAIGANALALATSGGGNTAVGYNSMGSAIVTGGFNTAIGTSTGGNITSGTSNTFIGTDAGSGINIGASNICIGRSATTGGPGTVNELCIGSGTYFVGTNGAATTYFPAGAVGAVAAPAFVLGFIKVRLNGALLKLAVYPD